MKKKARKKAKSKIKIIYSISIAKRIYDMVFKIRNKIIVLHTNLCINILRLFPS